MLYKYILRYELLRIYITETNRACPLKKVFFCEFSYSVYLHSPSKHVYYIHFTLRGISIPLENNNNTTSFWKYEENKWCFVRERACELQHFWNLFKLNLNEFKPPKPNKMNSFATKKKFLCETSLLWESTRWKLVAGDMGWVIYVYI